VRTGECSSQSHSGVAQLWSRGRRATEDDFGESDEFPLDGRLGCWAPSPPCTLGCMCSVTSAVLLGLGAAAAGASIIVQRHQSKAADAAGAVVLTKGNPKAGRALFDRRGCGACHAVFNDRQGGGMGGDAPRKDRDARLPGRAPAERLGSSDRLVQHPQAMDPGVSMPDAGLTDQDARDVPACLHTPRYVGAARIRARLTAVMAPSPPKGRVPRCDPGQKSRVR
jgi:hypothetical protein